MDACLASDVSGIWTMWQPGHKSDDQSSVMLPDGDADEEDQQQPHGAIPPLQMLFWPLRSAATGAAPNAAGRWARVCGSTEIRESEAQHDESALRSSDPLVYCPAAVMWSSCS